jgi:hypothetical protein
LISPVSPMMLIQLMVRMMKLTQKGSMMSSRKPVYSGFASVEKIGGDISHDNAEKNGLKRDADRADQNLGVKEIFEKLGVIAELKGRDVRPAGGAQPEAVDDDEAYRYDQRRKTALMDGASSRPMVSKICQIS